ncbi:unnamed protein product, partial [Allacma fusca]
ICSFSDCSCIVQNHTSILVLWKYLSLLPNHTPITGP